ncbi:MAG: hypothetical protein ABI047_11305 [Jatrophihabitantaceae bacterium]
MAVQLGAFPSLASGGELEGAAFPFGLELVERYRAGGVGLKELVALALSWTTVRLD